MSSATIFCDARCGQSSEHEVELIQCSLVCGDIRKVGVGGGKRRLELGDGYRGLGFARYHLDLHGRVRGEQTQMRRRIRQTADQPSHDHTCKCINMRAGFPDEPHAHHWRKLFCVCTKEIEVGETNWIEIHRA